MSTALKEQLVADRATLRQLLREHPDWSHRQLSEATQRSVSWVKDWTKRLKDAPPQNEAVLWGKFPRPIPLCWLQLRSWGIIEVKLRLT